MSQKHPLVVGLLVGILVGAGAVTAFNTGWVSDNEPDTPDDTPGLGLAISSGGVTCLNETVKPYGGWIHTVAHGERYDVTVNATIAHDRDEEVEVDLVDTGMDVYELQFVTRQRGGDTDSDSKTRVGTESKTCDVGTTIGVGGTIPSEFETLRVTVNGEVVQTIEKEGTSAILRQLPNPIET